MKLLVGLSLLSSMSFVFASDSFNCVASKNVVFSYECVVCTQVNGDNDCVKEETQKCYSEKSVVFASEEKVHPGQEFFLGKKTNALSFIISNSHSGYSARITSEKENAEATIESSTPLNPYTDTVRLKAKTNLAKNVENNVTEIVLTCSPK